MNPGDPTEFDFQISNLEFPVSSFKPYVFRRHSIGLQRYTCLNWRENRW